MKESQGKPKTSSSEPSSNPTAENPLKPFQDASMKYLEAAMSAQQSTMKDSAQACVDFQQALRLVQQDAYGAVVESTRKHMSKMSEQPTGKPEDVYSARMQSQMNYENEVRQAYANAQSRFNEAAQKFFSPEGGEAMKRFASLRQDAYQEYLADLRNAWSNTTNLDPQTIKAIASTIFYTLNVC